MAHNIGNKERTVDIKLNENTDFSQMLFSDNTFHGLKKAGFKYPSPIQLAAIPLGRCGVDLVIQAKSGTGKTLVFAIVALEMINTNTTTTQVLILAPTREIAYQIGTVFNSIGSKKPNLKTHTFIGGTNLENDKENLKMCHIAIGTPGRVKQLIELNFLKPKQIKLFVLDEADQLLNTQFMDCIVQIYHLLPSNKQVLALSATYSDQELECIKKLTISPSFVMLDKESPSLIGVKQFVYCSPFSHQIYVRHQKKIDILFKIISYLKFNQCIIFSNSQFRAESLCNQLNEKNWSVSYMSGAQQQNDRLKSFQALCSHSCRIMVSTDLSARGLDSEHVNLVINLDLPTNQATYLHRIGRAGRYGSLGYAITFACEGDEYNRFSNLVTDANLDVKVLPKHFKNFENLQITSSDDFTKLQPICKKATENGNDKQQRQTELDIINNEDLNLNKKQQNIEKYSNKEKLRDTQTRNFVGDSANENLIFPKGFNQNPFNYINDKILKNRPISYNEIFQQTSEVNLMNSESCESNILSKTCPYPLVSLDKELSIWKKLVSYYEINNLSFKLNGHQIVYANLNKKSDALKFIEAKSENVPNNDNVTDLQNHQNSPISNEDSDIIMKGNCIHCNKVLKCQKSLCVKCSKLKQFSGIQNMSVNNVQNSLNYCSLSDNHLSDDRSKNEYTGIGKWSVSVNNNFTTSCPKKLLNSEKYSNQSEKYMIGTNNTTVDATSNCSSQCSLKSHMVANDSGSFSIDIEKTRNKSNDYLMSSVKFMEMMNYTKKWGRLSASISRDFKL